MTGATATNPSDLREQGNQAFKQGQYQQAIDRYSEALNALTDLSFSDSIKGDLTKCYSNRSQCYMNLNQYDEAIEDATRGKEMEKEQHGGNGLLSALEYTPADQKSLYRRASAFERLGKVNEAISDAQRLISVSPKGGSGDEQTNLLLRKLRENAQSKVKEETPTLRPLSSPLSSSTRNRLN